MQARFRVNEAIQKVNIQFEEVSPLLLHPLFIHQEKISFASLGVGSPLASSRNLLYSSHSCAGLRMTLHSGLTHLAQFMPYCGDEMAPLARLGLFGVADG